FSSPAEALTMLYSPPVYGKRDPSAVMAPFFFLFFGMCLGDAGYALIMLGAMWLLFKKYRKIPPNIKTLMCLFVSGAVATFFYGLFTGGFFGDFIDAFPLLAFMRPLKNALLVIDPMQSPMTILGISILLGVIQLMFGLGVAAWDKLREGEIAEAIGDKVSWILFVVGLILFGLGSAGTLPPEVSSAGAWTAGAGALLIFWYAGRETRNIFMKIGAGLYALYGSAAYLGDILSYSRLLALGLGSAVIGSVVNMLASMIAGVPYVGWLFAIIVVVVGHLFNLAINTLGSFVHAMRLQFVEFFSKFYPGNGVLFKPLRLQTQYVEVLDE
ncbi:MAG: V-type ATP synthase subunit I, partial [Synergistaceae bacterium]|nr:V-type ATP synthase subunit I [Synergistaceae bacterium]